MVLLYPYVSGVRTNSLRFEFNCKDICYIDYDGTVSIVYTIVRGYKPGETGERDERSVAAL